MNGPSVEHDHPSPTDGRWGAKIAFGIWLAVAVPMLLGLSTFFFRDVFGWHFPLRAFGAAALRAGEIPAIHPAWAAGQPFRGNPNALAFYPGNLLYLLLPFFPAFNLHFCLHWLLAYFSMRTLARRLGQCPAAARLAGLTYAGQGFALSALTFYGPVAIYAWWPLVLAGAWEGGRRGTATAGLACGLAILGGEPVMTGVGVASLAFLLLLRPPRLPAAGRGLVILALGVLIGLPQVVATARVLPFTFRATRGVLESQAVSYSLHPWRLLELLLPFPFGIPGYPSDLGVTPLIPYILTLYCGSLALALALFGASRHRSWGGLAIGGYLLSWLGGLSASLLVLLTLGLFRFPEKFLFWPALAVPLLAGWGLETVHEQPSRWRKWAAPIGLAFLVAGVAALIGCALATTWLASLLRSWGIATTITGLALWLGANRLDRLVGLQLLSLAPLLPLLYVDLASPYTEAPRWVERLGPDHGVFNPAFAYPPWPEQRRWRIETSLPQARARAEAADLAPAPGIFHGLTYPLAPDIDGMHSPFFSLLLANLPRFSWEERLVWLRLLGVDTLVLYDDPRLDELELLDEATRFGRRSRLYRLSGVAPEVWWPRRLEAAEHPVDALRKVGKQPSHLEVAVVPSSVRRELHDPAGVVRLLRATADRIELEVRSGGGIVVLRRAYRPMYRARASGSAIGTLPVNLCLLGLQVPAGTHRVVVDVAAWPEIAAAVVALAVFVLVGLAIRLDGPPIVRRQ